MLIFLKFFIFLKFKNHPSLLDEAIIFTDSDFIYGKTNIVSFIYVNGKSVDTVAAGAENAGIVVKNLTDVLPEGSIIMIKKKS